MLAIDIQHRLGDFLLDARFETDSGLIALFGTIGLGQDLDSSTSSPA